MDPVVETQVEGDLVAAIDLGSNSFHMIVARLERGQLNVVDKMRERVRLGAGLDDRRNLTEDAQTRALDCLERFGERVRDMAPGHVRAVGTNTLRQAKNGAQFLERAYAALGHPIEIIAGREEARLIYLGVIQTMPTDSQPRLVVDIGGGSTEVVVGQRNEILEADSLFMGCVSFSRRYFGDGRITLERMESARIGAKLELQPIEQHYRELGWHVAYGCSGTVHAVKKVARANGWSAGEITPRVLKLCERALTDAEDLDRLKLDGLAEDRVEVIPGGVAILSAIVDTFRLREIQPAAGALREGALYDLVGRIRDEDVRDRTISWFTQRYSVDAAHVARVERTALSLLASTYVAWGLDRVYGERLLSWAAHLFEIGLTISHTGYHKHSAYVVAHADMAGFSRADQAMLAAIIQSHRRHIKRRRFREVPPDLEQDLLYYTLIFRFAVLLNRSRADEPMPPLKIEARDGGLTMVFPAGWLDAHPLSREDLNAQVEHLRKVDVGLEFSDENEPLDFKPQKKRSEKKKKKKRS